MLYQVGAIGSSYIQVAPWPATLAALLAAFTTQAATGSAAVSVSSAIQGPNIYVDTTKVSRGALIPAGFTILGICQQDSSLVQPFPAISNGQP